MIIFFSLLSTLSTSYWLLLAGRFVTAIGVGGILPVGVTYLAEYLPDENRGFYMVTMEIWRSVGGFLCTVIAMMSNNSWRFLINIPVFVICIVFIMILIFLPESTRYLLFKSRVHEVCETFNKMAKKNGHDFTVVHSYTEDNDSEKYQKKKNEGVMTKLFYQGHWKLTVPLIMLWFFPAFGSGIFMWLPELMFR